LARGFGDRASRAADDYVVCARRRASGGDDGRGRKREPLATIFGVFVAPEARGRGVGVLLLRALLDELRARPKIVKVMLSVNTQQRAAIQLYEKFGFRIVGTMEKELNLNGTYYDEYHMEKVLNV
jgi:ribosomal protein S18 acetylase RimI-like enzyme